MNFNSVFEELNKLYEEPPAEAKEKLDDNAEEPVAESCVKEELVEAVEDDEIEVVDDEEIEIVDDEAAAEDEEPKQTIIECVKCGALVIVDEVVVDEESDLVNVEDECKFCEEAAGYKIIGSVVPYETETEEADEEAADEEIAVEAEAEVADDEMPVEEALKETYYACAEIDGEEKRFSFDSREAAKKYIAAIKSGEAAEFAGKKIGSVWTEGFDAECADEQ